jgi:hypothetical protein
MGQGPDRPPTWTAPAAEWKLQKSDIPHNENQFSSNQKIKNQEIQQDKSCVVYQVMRIMSEHFQK